MLPDKGMTGFRVFPLVILLFSPTLLLRASTFAFGWAEFNEFDGVLLVVELLLVVLLLVVLFELVLLLSAVVGEFVVEL